MTRGLITPSRSGRRRLRMNQLGLVSFGHAGISGFDSRYGGRASGGHPGNNSGGGVCIPQG